MVCDEIERDLAIRYETPRVCYHLMMGRTRDNPYILLAHHSSLQPPHALAGLLAARGFSGLIWPVFPDLNGL